MSEINNEGREGELLKRWVAEVTDDALLGELRAMEASFDSGDSAPAIEAFHNNLAFGTGGLRGIIGAGTGRMNIYTVGRATQGFADYLKANFENPSVVIGRDSRNLGDQFVRRAAEVFAANGVRAYVFPAMAPTPLVSFATRDLGASGGVNITASHNPAPYNGYKAYGADGCQVVTDAAEAISRAMNAVDIFDDVKLCNFEDGVAAGTIVVLDDAVVARYLDAVAACSVATEADSAVPLRLVYTPLNGSGAECVGRILGRFGITDIATVECQANPDGNFPTCPYPNPEMPEALAKAFELAENVKPDLVLATDPDADRVGIAVQDAATGEFVLLSGNEVGVLLLHYLAAAAAARGESLAERLAVTTIVSSQMVDAIAEDFGFQVKRTLTGFKYIGEIIGELEERGEEGRYLFGFEESYGYLNGTYVRDKDAIDATMLICQMAQHYKASGMNLVQAMAALYERYGYFLNSTLSFTYPGVEGQKAMAALMEGLRSNAPAEVAGLAVEAVVDYAGGRDGLPPSDVLQLDLAGNNRLIIRPSGTEPKVKAYVFAWGASRCAAETTMADITAAVNKLLGA